MSKELKVWAAVMVTIFAVIGFVTFVNVIVLNKPEFCQGANP